MANVQASFILPLGLQRLYFDLENCVKVIEFSGPYVHFISFCKIKTNPSEYSILKMSIYMYI